MYVNGEEVARSNLPRGDVGYRTPAVITVVDMGELAFNDFAISPRLYQGPNFVAVEIHQQNPTSSDLVFDLALLGTGNAGHLPEPPLSPVSMINTGADANGAGGADRAVARVASYETSGTTSSMNRAICSAALA